MNKQELIKAVAENAGMTIAHARIAVETTLGEIIKGTSEGDCKVVVQGFGTFTKETRAGRMGRNPKTGAPVEILAKEVVKFKAKFDI